MHLSSCSMAIPQELLDKCKGVQGVMTAKKLDNHMALVHYQASRTWLGIGASLWPAWPIA